MTVTQPWQLQHPPEKWLQILQQALADHRANPGDQEALQAVQDANEALSVYDQAEAASPQERISAGLSGGPTALSQIGSNVGEMASHPINTAISSLRALFHPIDTAKNIASNFSETNTPDEVAKGVGNVGTMLLPAAKLNVGRSFKLGAVPGKTVAGLAVTPLAKAMKPLGEFFKRPGLKNTLLEKQIEQTGLHTDLLKQQVERAPAQTEAALRRVQMLEQQLERGPATAENLGLRNQLLQLKIELMQGGEGGGPAALPDVGPKTPQPLTDAARALTDKQLAEQPFGQTPAPEQSFNAGLERRVVQAADKMLGRRSTDFIGTGPESITPEALSKVQIIGAESPMATLGKAANKPASLEEIINRNAEPKALDTGTLSNQPESELGKALKKQTQKSVTFGKESTYPKSLKQDILKLLGEMSKEQ